MIAYHSFKQGPNQTNAEYLEIFTSNIQVLEHYKANIGETYLLIDYLNGTRNRAQLTQSAQRCTIAMAFLCGADTRCYESLWPDLPNQQTRENDQ
jgi:hypothetical protein